MPQHIKRRFKLKNLEFMPVINEFYAKHKNMKTIAREYVETFRKIEGCENAKVNMHQNYTEGYISVNGFGVPMDPDKLEKQVEIMHGALNTFARGKNYQPLRKNKYNREKTNNFEDLKVSYVPILKVIFGDPSPIKFIEDKEGQPQVLVKSAGFEMDGEDFKITVLEEDITDHLLANFEPLDD